VCDDGAEAAVSRVVNVDGVDRDVEFLLQMEPNGKGGWWVTGM